MNTIYCIRTVSATILVFIGYIIPKYYLEKLFLHCNTTEFSIYCYRGGPRRDYVGDLFRAGSLQLLGPFNPIGTAV